jgi:dihydroorotate dehydrogenase
MNRVLALHNSLYDRLARPLLFRGSAQAAHESLLRLLAELDANALAIHLLKRIGRAALHPPSVPSAIPPLTLAAGMVKGRGFPDEATALRAIDCGENLIPGWRSIPALVGPVEFGSFTRWPRLGNPGTVIWRDEPTRSTQNRVGLKNPGARAAAAFLARHAAALPPVFGLNIAVSPGVSDPAQERDEVLTSLGFFLEAGLRPAWFTLNLSCPNTEDDPGGHQTAARARDLCGAVVSRLNHSVTMNDGDTQTGKQINHRGTESTEGILLQSDDDLTTHPGMKDLTAKAQRTQSVQDFEPPRRQERQVFQSSSREAEQQSNRATEGPFGADPALTEQHSGSPLPSPQTAGRGAGGEGAASPIPLWIKISPELGPDQYAGLMQVCAAVGVRAIIATNTLPRPTPDAPNQMAGVGGGRLHPPALEAVQHLAGARERLGCAVQIIGCGGVLDGPSAAAFREAGADALQYWSALIYRGPLAAAVIQQELEPHG